MCVAGLGTSTIGNDRAVGKTSLKVGAVPLGESPLLGDNDELTAGELKVWRKLGMIWLNQAVNPP